MGENVGVGESLTWVLRWSAFTGMGVVTFAGTPHGHDMRLLFVQLAGYVIVGLALGAATLAERRGRRDVLPAAFAVACAAAGAVAATDDGLPMIVLAAIAALAAGSETKLGSALVVTGLGLVGFLVSAVISSQTDGALLAGGPAIIGTGLVLGLHRRTYRVQAEQAAELLERTRQVQELQRRTDVLDERARIAREIHDVLAHSLGGLGIQVQAARAVLTDHGDVDKAQELLATAQRMASDGLTETRRALHALREDTRPLDEELRELAADLDFGIEGMPRDVPAAATVALVRVAQEAVVNAAKHAAGQPVSVRLAYEPDLVRLTVSNPLGALGPRQLQTADGGYGLTGMKERLLLIGGTLTAGPRDDSWVVTASLPTGAGVAG
jgi:signal transduction histidine kinase